MQDKRIAYDFEKVQINTKKRKKKLFVVRIDVY